MPEPTILNRRPEPPSAPIRPLLASVTDDPLEIAMKDRRILQSQVAGLEAALREERATTVGLQAEVEARTREIARSESRLLDHEVRITRLQTVVFSLRTRLKVMAEIAAETWQEAMQDGAKPITEDSDRAAEIMRRMQAHKDEPAGETEKPRAEPQAEQQGVRLPPNALPR